MASSVSSERAFSQAGVTIRDRRTRLKADVVEALQFLKCAIRQDLIFRTPGPSVPQELELEELELELDGSESANAEATPSSQTDEKSWDLILDSDDEDLFDTEDD